MTNGPGEHQFVRPVLEVAESDVATKATIMNAPTRLRFPSMRTTTKGALRLRLPMAPPIASASVIVAVKLRTANIAATAQNSGWRNW